MTWSADLAVLAELRRLLAEATPGDDPWHQWHRSVRNAHGVQVAATFLESDAALIVALRNHADALLDVVEAAKTMREAGACPHIRKGTDAGANREWVAWQTKQAELDHALARLDGKETP